MQFLALNIPLKFFNVNVSIGESTVTLHYASCKASKAWTDCGCNTPALWEGPVKPVRVKPMDVFIPPVVRVQRDGEEENHYCLSGIIMKASVQFSSVHFLSCAIFSTICSSLWRR